MHRDITWVWNLCMKSMYSSKYFDSLDRFFSKHKVERILDASCGTGFPAIELSRRGYNIVCTDGSGQMLRAFRRNCVKNGVAIESKKLFWHELSKHFGEEFDAVLCRGNSLPYVVSWDDKNFDLASAPGKIGESIGNFFSVLKKGGLCYIDVSPRESFSPEKTSTVHEFKQKEINGKILRTVVNIDHDLVNRIRKWSPEVVVKHKNSNVVERVKVSFEGYLLQHSELVSFMKKAGFREIKQYENIPGEDNYDIFIGYK